MTHAEMTILIDQLQKEKTEMRQIEKKLERKLLSAPKENLMVLCSKGRVQFYSLNKTGDRNAEDTGVEAEHKSRTYLSKKNQETLRRLAQKKYDEALISVYKNNLNLFGNVISQLEKFVSPKDAIKKMPDVLQPYIAVPFLSTEDFVEQWIMGDKKQVGRRDNMIGQQGDWHPENLVYSTDNGDRVRSKSEMMIANLLSAMQLPYQYEKPLHLNGKTVFPDFTILDTVSRTEVYFEHFGLMDQEDYRTAALQKIVNYEKAGFVAGKDFLFSFESERVPFDIDWIRKKLCDRFGVEQ